MFSDDKDLYLVYKFTSLPVPLFQVCICRMGGWVVSGMQATIRIARHSAQLEIEIFMSLPCLIPIWHTMVGENYHTTDCDHCKIQDDIDQIQKHIWWNLSCYSMLLHAMLLNATQCYLVIISQLEEDFNFPQRGCFLNFLFIFPARLCLIFFPRQLPFFPL